VGVLKMNPFITYTHLGTDFGFHGPGGALHHLGPGQRQPVAGKSIRLGGHVDCSLAGIAVAPGGDNGFPGLLPDLITAAAQPQIHALAR